MVPAALSEQLAKALPSSEVASIAGAGHMLMMEKPLEVSAAIERALASWASR
jgi:pimeloyl-ACP methyl ester carboxylesterase